MLELIKKLILKIKNNQNLLLKNPKVQILNHIDKSYENIFKFKTVQKPTKNNSKIPTILMMCQSK